MTLSVGFIGSGMMASALMDGMIEKNVTTASSICCSDVYKPARDAAAAKGIMSTDSNKIVCDHAKDAVILAVKPQYIPDVCNDIAEATTTEEGHSDSHNPLIISIAAGVTIKALEEALPGHRVVRVMPNTPCLVGQAASGFSLGTLATAKDRVIVESIFGSVGIAMEVSSEIHLNAITGLSGSGPAYVFQFIEALSDGGVRCGLPRNVATQLAAQTVKGAAEMILETNKHPGLLKDGVTSPGGTTIAGVEALEKGGFRSATISAVRAATKRSMQLGGISEDEIQHHYNL